MFEGFDDAKESVLVITELERFGAENLQDGIDGKGFVGGVAEVTKKRNKAGAEGCVMLNKAVLGKLVKRG